VADAITSTSDGTTNEIVSLRKRRGRDRRGLFTVEGVRESTRATKSLGANS